MSEIHHLTVKPITAFAFNGDRTRLAIVPNSNTIQLYKKSGSSWAKDTELKGHDQRVTSLDWGAKHNRIVSCSQDRNAFVWDEKDGTWTPRLVILRINRAATHVRWSPNEDKFAVASGARLISVCYFEEANDWWVSKHIKKPIRSTVLWLEWHPNNVLLVAGSSDFRCRVFSGYIKSVDEKPAATVWGKKMTLGECMADVSNGHGGWVHGCSFSPSGDKIAFVSHDSTVSVHIGGQEDVQTYKSSGLPYRSVCWLTENTIVCGGYGCVPDVYSVADNGSLTFVEKLDHKKTEKQGRAVSAMNKFQTLDSRAASAGDTNMETVLETLHQNAINCVQPYESSNGTVSKIVSSGVDGRLIIWNIKALEAEIAKLTIA